MAEKRPYQLTAKSASQVDSAYKIILDKIGEPEAYSILVTELLTLLAIPTGGDFTPVGSGETYTTIQSALAAGKYRVELTSDVTESVDWGSHSTNITIITDGVQRIINMSVLNSSALTIYAKNVVFSLTGTNTIFHTDSYIYLDDCEITGDSSTNTFSQCIIDGSIIKINIGTNSLTATNLRNVDTLIINGNVSSLATGIRVIGSVRELETQGSFGSGKTDSDIIVTLYNATVISLTKGHSDESFIFAQNSKILTSNGTGFNLRESGAGHYYNCIIDHGRFLSGSFFDCTITDVAYIDLFVNKLHNCTIAETNLDLRTKNTYNCSFQSVTITGNSNIYENSTFTSILVNSDNNHISNCNITGSTVTIAATADNTKISNTNTATTIVNSGTNTQIVNSGVQNEFIDDVNIAATKVYKVANVQVIATQQTGVSAMTNVTSPSNLDADTVTVAELADIVGTLISKLRTHGLITT